jgi:hypothetical protein
LEIPVEENVLLLDFHHMSQALYPSVLYFKNIAEDGVQKASGLSSRTDIAFRNKNVFSFNHAGQVNDRVRNKASFCISFANAGFPRK